MEDAESTDPAVQIALPDLPRHPIITEAVSEMFLAYNRDNLRVFYVHSPLTDEAREVVFRLPGLAGLWVIIQEPSSLPTAALPNLAMVGFEYTNDLGRPLGFPGATLEKLEAAVSVFQIDSNRMGDFFGMLESVAEFKPYISSSRNSNYSTLLPFTKLREVEIEFSCKGGCISRVDDDVIVCLARGMPELEILQLENPYWRHSQWPRQPRSSLLPPLRPSYSLSNDQLG